jgi:TM2 domain-containing membrane protein YozV
MRYKRTIRGMMHSKTMWFSLGMMIFGAVEMYFPYLRENIQPQYYGPIFMVIGVICAILRFLTTLPLEDK